MAHGSHTWHYNRIDIVDLTGGTINREVWYHGWGRDAGGLGTCLGWLGGSWGQRAGGGRLGGIGKALTVVMLPIAINTPVTAIPNQWCIFIVLSFIEISLWYTDNCKSINVPEVLFRFNEEN
jgi:hypothetical protein